MVGTVEAGQVIKVLQLNFNSEIVGFDDRAGHMREQRYRAILDYIRQESPDVVLIEEGWNYKHFPSLAIPLAQDLGYDQFYRIGLGFPWLLWDSNLVLAKKELRMKEKRKVQLPHSAWHLGDEINWVIPFGAITNMVGARLTLADGQPLVVYATHLLGANSGEMIDQVKALDHEIQKHAVGYDHVPWDQANVIVAGDMNADPSTEAMRYLRDAGYVDTWAAAHPDHFDDNVSATNCGDPFAPRFNPMTIAANQLPAQSSIDSDNRIDYIYARGPRVRVLASTQVFTHEVEGFWMSDHYGLLTTLAIDDETAPPVANPLNDSDGLALPEHTNVVVSDDDFATCADRVDCEIDLLDRDVSAAAGLAFVNKSGEELSAKIEGGTVWPSAHTKLKGGQASSFVFMQAGDYRLVVHNAVGDTLRARLHVSF